METKHFLSYEVFLRGTFIILAWILTSLLPPDDNYGDEGGWFASALRWWQYIYELEEASGLDTTPDTGLFLHFGSPMKVNAVVIRHAA